MKKFSRLKTKDYFEQIENLGLEAGEKDRVVLVWLSYFDMLKRKATRGKRFDYTADAIIITFGAGIPVIAQVSGNESDWLITGLSVTLTVLTAISKQFNFDLRRHHYHYHAERMRYEGESFITLTGPYSEFSTHEKALSAFCAAVSNYKLEELNMYQTQGGGNVINSGGNNAGQSSGTAQVKQ